MTDKKELKSPPAINPFVFPVLLMALGLWFSYDGWLTANTDMHEHQMFNRIGSVILFPWGIIDFIRTLRYAKKAKVISSPGKDD